MADYSAGSASVTIQPNLDRFANTLRAGLSRIKVNYGVTVDPDTSGFHARLKSELATNRPTVDVVVSADTAVARAEIAALSTNRRVNIGVDADTAAAAAKIETVQAPRSTNITADADVAAAEALLTTASRDRTTTFRVNTSPAVTAVVTLGTAFNTTAAMGAKLSAISGVITAIGGAAAGTISPLSAMVGAIAQASGSLAALPGIAAGGIAGVATIAVGVNGLGDAFSAMGDTASGSMGDVSEATEGAEKQVKSAQRAVEDAGRGIERAQRGIADAERGVTDAQEASRRAQDDLNNAREDAVRTLEDMNDRLNDAALDEEGATIAVARAQQRLNKVRADSGSSALDIQEADLAYRKAVNTLEDMRVSNNRLAEDTAEANRKGVEGADNVVNAKRAVQDAQRGEEQAQQRLADAYQGLEDAQRNMADAQEAAADAQKELAKAMQGTGGAADKAAEAMAKLAPNAREFVNAVRSMGDQWTELRKSVQNNMFEGMGEAITTLGNKQLPVLKTGMEGIATVMNEDVRNAMGVFSTDEAASKFGTFLENTRQGFDALGNALTPISSIWINLTTAGSAYFERFGDSITRSFSRWDESLAAAVSDGRFDEFMERSIDSAQQLGRIISSAWSGLGNVFGAASAASGGFMNRMEDTMARFDAWGESVQGQNALAEFFDAANRSLAALSPIMGQALNIFATTMVPGMANLLEAASPGFQTFMDHLKSTMETLSPLMPKFGEALGAIAANLGPTLGVMATVTGPILGIFLDTIIALSPALVPFLTTIGLVSGVLLKFGGFIMWVVGVARRLWAMLGMVKVAFTLLKLAFAVSPFGVIITAIGVVVGALVWFFTKTELGRELWGKFTSFLGGCWDKIVGFFNTGKEKIGEWYEAFIGFIQDIPDKFRKMKDDVLSWFSDSKEWLIDAGKDIVDGLINGIGNIGETIGNWILDKLPGPIKGVVKDVLGLAEGGEVEGLRLGGPVVGPPTYAKGGQLPTTGPGTYETDGILGVDGNGVPTARVDAGEYVVNARETDRFRNVLQAINAGNKTAAMAALQDVKGYALGGQIGGARKKPQGLPSPAMPSVSTPSVDTSGLSTAQSAFTSAAQGIQQSAASTLNPVWAQQSANLTNLGLQAQTSLTGTVTPQFQTMASAVSTAANTLVNPALKGTGLNMVNLATQVTSSAVGTIQPVWQNMARFMSAMKTGTIDPMFLGIQGRLSAMGSKVYTTATGTVQPVWRNMSNFMSNAKATVMDPMFAGIGNSLTVMGTKVRTTAQSVVQPLWQQMGSFMVQVKTGTIDPMFRTMHNSLNTFEGWVSTTVTNASNAWNRLKRGTGAPARFMVETVFNNGIRPAWNNIADLIDGKDLKKVNLGNLGAYASGGTVDTVPGYSPGYDDHTFSNGKGSSIHLSGGEAIMRPEWTRAVGGRAAVNRMNRQAANGSLGKSGNTPAFARGGVYQPNDREKGQLGGAPIATSLWKAAKTAFPNATLNSAKTDHGNDGGYHPQGGAVDLGGPMQQIANWIFKTYPNSAQLIFGPGPLTLNGKTGRIPNSDQAGIRAAYGEGTMAGHYNHVHWASDGVINSAGKMVSMAGGTNGDPMLSISDMVKEMWSSETKDIKKWTGPKSKFGDAMNSLRSVMIKKLGKFAEEQAEKIGIGPGSPAGEGAERWRPMVIKAFKYQGEDPTKFRVDGLVGQIGYESNGQEKVIQNGYVDVNTGGNEAAGLLQFVPGTFEAHRDPRIPGDRFDGWANINAGVRYYRDHWNYDPWIGRNGPHGWKNGGVLNEDDMNLITGEDEKERKKTEAGYAAKAASDHTSIGEAAAAEGDESADALNDFRASTAGDPNSYDTSAASGMDSQEQTISSWADIVKDYLGYKPREISQDADPMDPKTFQDTYHNIAGDAATGHFEDLLTLIGAPTTAPPMSVAYDELTNAFSARNKQDPIARTSAEWEAQDRAVRQLPAELQPSARGLVRNGYNLIPGNRTASKDQVAAYRAAQAKAAADEAKKEKEAAEAQEASAAEAQDALAAEEVDKVTDGLSKYATGGLISGPGGPTEDMVPILASAGEFITNAATTAQATPLLMALNADPAAAAALQSALMGTKGVGQSMTAMADAAQATRPAINAMAGTPYADAATLSSGDYSRTTENHNGKAIELHYHVETNDAQQGLRMAEQQAKQQLLAMGGA